jgi:hypothetical protein
MAGNGRFLQRNNRFEGFVRPEGVRTKSTYAVVAGKRRDGTVVSRLALFRKKASGDLPAGAMIGHAFTAQTALIARIGACAVFKILRFV